jgi:hypothetical protein
MNRFFSNEKSVLLKSQDSIKLIQNAFQRDFELSLLMRGSRDSYSPADFHRLCDGQGQTLVVIESTKGFIFGGFTSVSWTCPKVLP